MTALALLREGYAVALAGRRPEPLQETAKLAGASSEQSLVVTTDVGDAEGGASTFRKR